MQKNPKDKKKIFLYIGVAIVVIAVAILLVVLFSKEKFSVTFTVDNKIYNELDKVRDGDTIELPSAPKKEGYTFEGWYLNGKKFDSKTKVEENIVLEAKFTINTYTVTFDSDNNSNNITKDVTYNETVKKPKDPTKKGYTFAGWYVGDEKYNFNTKVTKDLTITAKWTKVTTASYTVEHYLMNLDGTYDNVYAKEVLKGKINSAVSPSPKNYVGFTTPSTQTTEIEEDGSTTIKYYYERNKYTLTVIGDEGIKETSGSGTYYYGSNVEISATLNTGYEFDTWSNKETNSKFTFVVYDNNVEIKASSKLKNYSIRYEALFEDGEKLTLETTNSKTFTIKDTIELEEETIEGYTFVKYLVNGKELENNIIKGYTEDLVVTAVFETNSYTVKFETTKGSFNSDEDRSLVVKYKELIPNVLLDESKKELYTPVREGYQVIGWSLNNEDEKQELYDFNTPMVANDIVLYPVWNPIDYTIDYALNEDEVCLECEKLTTYNIESEITLPVPTKEGYLFAGWVINGLEEETIITNITKGNTGNLLLSAKWYEIVDKNKVGNDLIGNIEEFTAKEMEDEFVIGFYNYEKTFEEDYQVIEGLSNNIKLLLDNSNILKLVIKYNDSEYEFNSNDLENITKKLQILIAAIGEKDSYDNVKTEKFEILDTKQINVLVLLNPLYARTENNKTEFDYNIRFQKLVKISAEDYNEVVKVNEGYINSHKDTHYEAVVEGNNLIFKYNNPSKTVFSTMSGAGLRTAMQEYLGNKNVGYIVITLEGMKPVKVTYDDIKEDNFWNFGFKLLDDFEAVVGKGAFRMKNEDLIALKATLEIFPPDGYYYDELITTKFNISFEPRNA